MAQDSDKPQDAPQGEVVPEFSEEERRTLRDVIQSQQETSLEEEQSARRAVRRKKRDERAVQRRTEREDRARQTHAHRLKALNGSTQRVSAHVGTAARSLSAALRALTEVPMPRHTAEGREQQRVAHALKAALGAVRRVGRGTFHETDVDISAETDAV